MTSSVNMLHSQRGLPRVDGTPVGAGAFGEDVDGLPVFVHLRGGFVEGGDGLGAGFALDEDSFAEGHCWGGNNC